jgi:hypothetical protein
MSELIARRSRTFTLLVVNLVLAIEPAGVYELEGVEKGQPKSNVKTLLAEPLRKYECSNAKQEIREYSWSQSVVRNTLDSWQAHADGLKCPVISADERAFRAPGRSPKKFSQSPLSR